MEKKTWPLSSCVYAEAKLLYQNLFEPFLSQSGTFLHWWHPTPKFSHSDIHVFWLQLFHTYILRCLNSSHSDSWPACLNTFIKRHAANCSISLSKVCFAFSLEGRFFYDFVVNVIFFYVYILVTNEFSILWVQSCVQKQSMLHTMED